MVETVLTAVASSLASKAVDSVFGGAKEKGKVSEAPTPSPTAVAPTRDDEASRRASRQRQAALQQRSGRQSTILSDIGNGGTLG